MEISSAIILGLVQALTEFLPISSSGHLVLFQHILERANFSLPQSVLTFDILIHFATLLVVFVYLRKEIKKYFFSSKEEFFSILLPFVLGFVPAGISGGLVLLFFGEVFESITFVACGFLLTALILELAHKKEPTNDFEIPSPKQALLIGLAQAVAVLPGVSRSGSTVGAGLLLGLPKETSLKFSFLISIPIILAATIVKIPELSRIDAANIPAFAIGFIVSFAFGLLAIKLLEIFVNSSKLRHFAIYLLCLSGVLFLL